MDILSANIKEENGLKHTGLNQVLQWLCHKINQSQDHLKVTKETFLFNNQNLKMCRMVEQLTRYY